MSNPVTLPWQEPLSLAQAVGGERFVLLYSAAQTSYSGRYSYLACDMAESIESNDFTALAQKLADGKPGWNNTWFGYLGYGLKDCLEAYEKDAAAWPDLPGLFMMRFHAVYRFDHAEKTVTLWGKQPVAKPMCDGAVPKVTDVVSNMRRETYLAKAKEVIERIHAGDLYQANLTRKFGGRFEREPDAFALFKKLCAVSPAPYSAFLKLGDVAILSSSPEQFLSVDAHGTVVTRPIKGTAARFADAAQDAKSRANLEASEKDRAENLMIVDLMRNDLARTCGDIEVTRLFEATTHATIHHLSSTVAGRRREGFSTLDVVKGCFPPGSMTGAPKISAVNLCSKLERDARGVYSGAIGWLAGDGAAELSVVIRTLIIKGARFEFQVGGGIVADSTPERELAELIEKSRGICSALGIDMHKLHI